MGFVFTPKTLWYPLEYLLIECRYTSIRNRNSPLATQDQDGVPYSTAKLSRARRKNLEAGRNTNFGWANIHLYFSRTFYDLDGYHLDAWL